MALTPGFDLAAALQGLVAWVALAALLGLTVLEHPRSVLAVQRLDANGTVKGSALGANPPAARRTPTSHAGRDTRPSLAMPSDDPSVVAREVLLDRKGPRPR